MSLLNEFTIKFLNDTINMNYMAGTADFPSEGLLLNFTDNSKYYPNHFVYNDSNTLYVITRYSLSDEDWQTDIDFHEVDVTFGNTTLKVHRGAYYSAQHVYQNTKKFMQQHNGRIIITGFSLGACVSSIMTPMALTDPDLAGKNIVTIALDGAPVMSYLPPEYTSKTFHFINNVDLITTISGQNLYDTYRESIEAKNFKEKLIADVKAIKMESVFFQTMYDLLMNNIDSLTESMYSYHQDKNKLNLRYMWGTVLHIKKGVHYNFLNETVINNTEINRVNVYEAAINDHSLWSLQVRLLRIGDSSISRMISFKLSIFIIICSIVVIALIALAVIAIYSCSKMKKMQKDQQLYSKLSSSFEH